MLGLHPKRALTEDGFKRLRNLLDQKEVAGLGEVGIDRTEPATRESSVSSSATSCSGFALPECWR